jgi:hypothetical protein
VIEAGSNIPKLQAAKQALLLQLAQMGMLNLDNPSNRVQFQQDMGVMGYSGDIEPDRKRATWENDLLDNLENSPDNRPVVLAIDNHDLHIQEHQTRMKSPTFMALSLAVQKAYSDHIQQHENFKNMAMQAQMLQQQAMGAPPTPPNPMPGPKPKAGAGGVVPEEVRKATMGADLANPATLGNGR